MKQNLRKFIFFSFLLLTAQVTFAQEKEIKGTVTSKADGIPLPGVNVIVQGTSTGAQTDFDGNYSLTASVGDILSFSYIGMTTIEITVGDSNTINVQFEEDATALDEVVVTALGIKKERKALTYSAQDVKGDELTRVKQTNPINSLSGKSAGLTITRSSSGVGGATKVVLRGNSSNSNNDPLYVIDGIPMQNSGNGAQPGGDIFGSETGNRDGGDISSLINPDDVESITILKGASAAALYGSQGANGVILITTKSGKEGKLKVNFNTTFTVDNVTSLPKLQTEYQSASVGQPLSNILTGEVADPKSWGAKTGGLSNTVDDFFETGYTATQAISLSAGSKKAQTYFSFANTSAGGVVPGNKLNRNVLNLRETASFLDDKIQISANVNLSDQRIWNRPTNGLYSNPLTGLYLNPVGIDLNNYKNQFEYFNPVTNQYEQYRTSFDENIQQNPYWLINRNQSKDIAQRVLASVSAKYQITDAFSLQTRGSFDKSFFTYDKRTHAGGDLTFAPGNRGRYILEKTENTQQYIDLIGIYNKDLSEDFNLTLTAGTSLTKYKTGDQVLLDSGQQGLIYSNIFDIANFEGTRAISQNVFNREVQSVFGAANIGYKNMLYLDITGRNDWSSTLARTASPSFFYPSVGLTGVLSEMFEMPEAISFAKVRASYAEVGKDLPAYATNPLGRIVGGVVQPPAFRFVEGDVLEPEKQKSFEIGTEWRFFNNRLGFDFTYYNSSTTNQIFIVNAPDDPSGTSKIIVNAGEITNTGLEIVLNAKPILNDNFNWNTAVNFAQNKNEVVSLYTDPQSGGQEPFIITDAGVNGYGYQLVVGEDFGSITGSSVMRDANGLPIVSDDGNSTIQKTEKTETIAHAQPDFTLGWNNTFTYKNWSLNILIDGKFGGDVVSVTEAVNDKFGVSQTTADARNTNGGMINVVDTNGVASQITAQDYYNQVGGRDGALGEYVYDATNISLRELALGYTLPTKSKYFESINLSLIANNLFFIYKDAPFDPNIASSTGLGLQGVDIYGQPSTRSIGLNVNINF